MVGKDGKILPAEPQRRMDSAVVLTTKPRTVLILTPVLRKVALLLWWLTLPLPPESLWWDSLRQQPHGTSTKTPKKRTQKIIELNDYGVPTPPLLL
jgi:hypothetical protein